jgi:hypothetical protein
MLVGIKQLATKTPGRLRHAGSALSLAFALLVTATAVPVAAQSEKPTIFVYLPTDIRPNAFQKMLEDSAPNVAVTVFGRIRDFQKNLKSTPPDAVLAAHPVIEDISLPIGMQGKAGGATDEQYVLVSVGQEVDLAKADLVIGTVDLLGRKKMDGFVNKLIGRSDKTKLKRVTKREDLLSLLQFKVADAILLRESSLEAFKGKSKLDLKFKRIEGARVGLPAVGFLPDARRKDIEAAVTKLQVN